MREEGTKDKLADATCNVCTTWVARFVPISPVPDGSRFLVRKNGRLMATPLLVALVAIEATELVFAVDSIPAVLAVTRDPLLVYTSNVFALLGLRSLYFVGGFDAAPAFSAHGARGNSAVRCGEDAAR